MSHTSAADQQIQLDQVGLSQGIVTLGNDYVVEQIVALLNSIEAIMGPEMPVCIYPYDNRVEKLTAAIAHRPQESLYTDAASIEKWDAFAKQAWDAHPTAKSRWQAVGDTSEYHRIGTHRRYCAFDGPFDQFIYMDADTLLLDTVTPIFEQLKTYQFLSYDFQYSDPTHVYEITSKKLHQVFSPDRVSSEIFCSGFYATHRSVFNPEQLAWLLTQLAEGDADVLYPMAPDQTLLNYMVMKTGLAYANLSRLYPASEITGNSVTSSHFEVTNHIAFDKGRRLTYLHYIGISARWFDRLCAGENILLPYRELFLYYRYLGEDQQPALLGEPIAYNRSKLGRRQRLNKLSNSLKRRARQLMPLVR